VRTLRTIIQNPGSSETLGITPIECLDYRIAASLIEGIGDSCVQEASNTIALNGTKPSTELRKLLLELQCACCEANEQAIKAFIAKDISVAENVRNMQKKIEATYCKIEAAAKEDSVDFMPQILAAVSFLRQIFDRSVDMTDLVV
jgi:phosphate uptake regulator